MIKILILDDSDRKIDKIKQVLVEGCDLHENDIEVAKSVANGRKARIMRSISFDAGH